VIIVKCSSDVAVSGISALYSKMDSLKRNMLVQMLKYIAVLYTRLFWMSVMCITFLRDVSVWCRHYIMEHKENIFKFTWFLNFVP